MGTTLIRAENLSKKFCRDLKYSLWYGMSDLGRELSGRARGSQLRTKEFWALRDISFELKRGEVLGLIGRNGAGKTTLLRMLNGLIKPDAGKIRVRGRLGALIALGMGFNPILSGRENVYVNGAILGLNKAEIDQRFKEIVDFAELEEFIDSPVRSYSTGMRVRLGFATAIKLVRPDVLLLDEVLAVGDAAFRAKCINAIVEIIGSTAVVFVSHDETQVKRIATHILLLEGGRLMDFTDNVARAFSTYNSLHVGDNGQADWFCHQDIHVDDARTTPPSQTTVALKSDEGFAVELLVSSRRPVVGVTLRLFAVTMAGQTVVVYEAKGGRLSADVRNRLCVSVDRLQLGSGLYEFRLEALDDNLRILFRNTSLCQVSVESNYRHCAPLELQANLSQCQ